MTVFILFAVGCRWLWHWLDFDAFGFMTLSWIQPCDVVRRPTTGLLGRKGKKEGSAEHQYKAKGTVVYLISNSRLSEKPALIYLRDEIEKVKKKKKITKKGRKHTNMCRWRSLFIPVLGEGSCATPPQGGDRYTPLLMNVCCFSLYFSVTLLVLNPDVRQHWMEMFCLFLYYLLKVTYPPSLF